MMTLCADGNTEASGSVLSREENSTSLPHVTCTPLPPCSAIWVWHLSQASWWPWSSIRAQEGILWACFLPGRLARMYIQQGCTQRLFHTRYQLHRIRQGKDGSMVTQMETTHMVLGLKVLSAYVGNQDRHPWQKSEARDFPGGPVVRTLRFHRRGLGLDPWLGN